MADQNDFATAVGALIKGRYPVKGVTSSWNFPAPGLYSNWTAAGSPTPSDPQTWTILVAPTPNTANLTALAVSWQYPGEVWAMRKNAGTWSTWKQVGKDLADKALIDAKTYALGAAEAAPSVNEHALRIADLRRRHGPIRTDGKTVVTLICDHGTNKFASIVLPALKARGMTCTLALNSKMYDQSVYSSWANETDTNWAMIRGWAVNDRIEIANHTATHHNATGRAAIRAEIIGGREELEANLPDVKIDTFVQIGTPTAEYDPAVGSYDGFRDGLGYDRYWSTEAGRFILNGHAVAFGNVPVTNRVYDLRGEPPVGANGLWIDNGQTGIDTAKTWIDQAVANGGGGVVVRMHPYVIDWPNQISTAQLGAFLDYLKALVDSGKVEVRTAREWAIADTSRQAVTSDPGWTDITSTAPADLITEGSIRAWKVGPIVYLHLDTVQLASRSAWQKVAVLPAKYCPAYDVRLPLPVGVGSGGDQIDIYTSGAVHLSGHTDFTTPVEVLVSWPTTAT